MVDNFFLLGDSRKKMKHKLYINSLDRFHICKIGQRHGENTNFIYPGNLNLAIVTIVDVLYTCDKIIIEH
jgi:hypothetical protein